ncbi:MAG: hypothetical protein R3182_07830, partial [Draconibacterium sp.]|nr:hypothetical protein [Draconibacterium sp.]
LPFVLLYAGMQIYFQRNVLSGIDLSDQETIMANIGPFYLNLFMFMLFSLFIQSLLIGTFYSYVEAYIKQGKDKFQISDISSKLFANSLLALGANLALFVIVMFGFIMCVLPGIYFLNTFSLAIFIFIFEKKGLGDTLTRSWKLVNTQWWNTLVLNLLGIVIVYAAGMVLSIPAMVLGISNNMFSVSEANPIDYPDWYWILTGFSAVVTTILLVIPLTFQAFQYFNLDERENPSTELDQKTF